jgi:hypothetical protein
VWEQQMDMAGNLASLCLAGLLLMAIMIASKAH